MPTGYTDYLDKNDFDVKKWITESLVRNFGVCVAFRDSGGMTKEEMLKAFEESAKNSYYKRELTKITAEKEKLKKLSDAEWKEMMENDNAKWEKDVNEGNRVRKRIRDGHARAQLYLSGLLACDISEVTKNILQFGLEQLKLVEDDYKRETTQILSTDIGKYKKNRLGLLQSHMDYCKKELIKEEERETERLEVYKRILEDVDKIEDEVNAYCVAERLSQ